MNFLVKKQKENKNNHICALIAFKVKDILGMPEDNFLSNVCLVGVILDDENYKDKELVKVRVVNGYGPLFKDLTQTNVLVKYHENKLIKQGNNPVKIDLSTYEILADKNFNLQSINSNIVNISEFDIYKANVGDIISLNAVILQHHEILAITNDHIITRCIKVFDKNVDVSRNSVDNLFINKIASIISTSYMVRE